MEVTVEEKGRYVSVTSGLRHSHKERAPPGETALEGPCAHTFISADVESDRRGQVIIGHWGL